MIEGLSKALDSWGGAVLPFSQFWQDRSGNDPADLRCICEVAQSEWRLVHPTFSRWLASQECPEVEALWGETAQMASLLQRLRGQWKTAGRPEVAWPEAGSQGVSLESEVEA